MKFLTIFQGDDCETINVFWVNGHPNALSGTCGAIFAFCLERFGARIDGKEPQMATRSDNITSDRSFAGTPRQFSSTVAE